MSDAVLSKFHLFRHVTFPSGTVIMNEREYYDMSV